MAIYIIVNRIDHATDYLDRKITTLTEILNEPLQSAVHYWGIKKDLEEVEQDIVLFDTNRDTYEVFGKELSTILDKYKFSDKLVGETINPTILYKLELMI